MFPSSYSLNAPFTLTEYALNECWLDMLNECWLDMLNECWLDMLNECLVSSGGGDDGIPTWGIAVIVVISVICAGMLGLILTMRSYERKGKPMFQPLIMENPLAGGLQTLGGKGNF
jgi:hypothetical protein